MSGSSKYAPGLVPEDKKEKGSILGETINQMDIVCTLAPLLRIEKKEVKGVTKEWRIELRSERPVW